MKASEKIILWITLLLVLVVGAVVLFKPSAAATTQPQKAGAITSPDLPYTYLHWGSGYGLVYLPTVQAIAQGTTTPCIIISPNGTSTLEEASIRFDTSSTTGMTIAFGKGTNTGVISTAIGSNYVIAANAQAFIEASTSQGLATNVFAPNTPLLWLATGGTGTYSPVGSCEAQWDLMPQ